MTEIKDQILFYLSFFVSPESYTPDTEFEYPDIAMGYLHTVSCLISRLPTWQNPLLNKETRSELLEKVAQAWSLSVSVILARVQGGKMYPPQRCREWASYLLSFNGLVQGELGIRTVVEEYMNGLGWLFDTTGLELGGQTAQSSNMSLGSTHSGINL